MAEDVASSEEMQKMQKDLVKMKQVAKLLMQQKKQLEAENEKLKQEQITSQKVQSQLEDAMEAKNLKISTLKQKLTHKVRLKYTLRDIIDYALILGRGSSNATKCEPTNIGRIE